MTSKQLEIPKEEIKEIVEKYFYDLIVDAIAKEKRRIVIDFSEIERINISIAESLLKFPEQTISLFEKAVSEIRPPTPKELEEGKKIKLNVRFKNLPESCKVEIRNLRSEHLGRMIVIEGVVKIATDVRPIARAVKYKCQRCGWESDWIPLDLFQAPPKMVCPNCKKSKDVVVWRKSLVDAQRVVLEEFPEIAEGQPKKLNVLLLDDLVDPDLQRYTIPGKRVRVSGVLKEIQIKKKEMYDFILVANYIEPLSEEIEEIVLTEEDIKKIKELAKDPEILNRIVKSIAPSIAGYEEIKKAIALQLFGGVKKERPDGTKVRGDIHILLVGDPGVGKSQILKHVAKLAHKGMYVSGKGATGVGITATVTKDELLGGWALEVGPAILMSGGILCIDEMDKIRKDDLIALHELMEQQSVSIAKANIHATLKAETTILAAANPKFGRFDPYRPIPEQIDLPPTIINRFDLIFPLRDIPEEKKDEYIMEHIIKGHMRPEELRPEIPLDILRKYIAYARQNVFPRLTEEAAEEIKKFYMKLRKKAQSFGEGIKPIPISPRQLEALIRLSEAVARIKLKEKVEKEDAKIAIELMTYYLREVGMDPETGLFDIDRVMTGIPAKKRDKIARVMEIVERLSKEFGGSAPIEEILKEAEDSGIDPKEVRRILEDLKRKGDIFEPIPGKYAPT